VLCALSRFAEALASLDRAIAVGPPTAEIHSNRGLALYELDRDDEALASYQRAIALRPDFSPPHIGMAAILCRLGRYREAVAHEEAGLALRTDWNGRIDRLIAEERYADGAALMDEALASSPSGAGNLPRSALVCGPIRRLVVDTGHHLMHPAEAGDIAEACGLPVELADLSTAAPTDFGASADTLVIYSHGIRLATAVPLRAIKKAAPDCPVVTWNFANHTAYLANALLAAAADAIFPAHVTPVEYLARWRCGAVVPLALFQWSRATLGRLYQDCRREPRSDRLSGHFSLYPVAKRRNRLIAEAIEAWPEADLSLERGWRYHDFSPRDRFLTWRRAKTSLVLPVAGDLSMRFFDALAAGQVPIVPRDIFDFDRVIPPADQTALPVIRLERYDVASLRAAHAAAITAFDRGGEAGAEARHRYVLQQHMLAHRIRDILGHVTAARPPGEIA
jgi:tetratricopeptide (TPR) repeat protein